VGETAYRVLDVMECLTATRLLTLVMSVAVMVRPAWGVMASLTAARRSPAATTIVDRQESMMLVVCVAATTARAVAVMVYPTAECKWMPAMYATVTAQPAADAMVLPTAVQG
jgi:hypothetical protein